MIIIKSDSEIDLMRESGKVTGFILKELENIIRPGLSTADIDRFVEKTIRGAGMIPSFKGYGGFPASACVSINDEVVHGIPDKKRILREGDIVSVDVGSTYKGYVSDAARTYPVGEVSDVARHLMEATRDSFFAGLEYCKVGCRLSDISHAIQQSAEGEGFSVIRDFVGHGVGQNMHEDPQIPNFGKAGRGPRLAKGMVFAIEPMICEGTYDVRTLSNDWTVVTLDGKLSAHYENTVVITDGEPELLTLGE
ncbi:MAG: type I methionyl aminopeptidase [Clostridiales bacterium]|nr:type I methionyl aminopeptidase [Clostridiales bacterium]MDD6764434.1 type I methionyl aminopeptidase [Bacillota bacterium]MDY6173536.1 type I methionyl aminopeptidase [Lentihominibacter sp.]MCI7392593.1 type I methionyl aminopeptidase [Clostridiales bacterium]MDD6979005.1 type I methionyl aminopeptidase [Bacillota bacterium]